MLHLRLVDRPPQSVLNNLSAFSRCSLESEIVKGQTFEKSRYMATIYDGETPLLLFGIYKGGIMGGWYCWQLICEGANKPFIWRSIKRLWRTYASIVPRPLYALSHEETDKRKFIEFLYFRHLIGNVYVLEVK